MKLALGIALALAFAFVAVTWLALEAGSPENPWFADLGRDPRLALRADGVDGVYVAERRDDADSRARVRAKLREKYGLRDSWVGLFVDQSKSLVVRLAPAGP